MTAPPLVDIVVPTFNQAEFLKTAIESVVRQTVTNWKMTVINNFSNDATLQVVESFGDPRIEVLNFANQGVIAASRNLGLRKATGQFVAFLDSDDWWYEEKLQRCVESLLQSGDLVCHAELWRSQNKERVVRYGPSSRATYRSLMLGGNRLSTSAVVGKTEIFHRMGGFSESARYITAEDYDLWLRMARTNVRFKFLDTVLGVYRIHPLSASSSVEKHARAELAVVEDHMTSSDVNWILRRHRKALVHYSAGRVAQRNKQNSLAFRKFLQTIRLSIGIFRVYPALLILLKDALMGRGK